LLEEKTNIHTQQIPWICLTIQQINKVVTRPDFFVP
jgi:hypothetical protein